jgi:dihydropyrimidinase
LRNIADVAVRGGTVVTSGATCTADLAIRDGKIAQIGGVVDAEEEIDARRKLVLPGGVDMHVHLSTPPGAAEWWADNFVSGSRAAAAGGVTTVGDMTFPNEGEGLRAALDRVGEEAAAGIVDFVLHPVLFDPTPERIAEIPRLAEDGHTSIKWFMTIPDFDRKGAFLESMSVAGENGVLTLVHCEEACIVDHAAAQLVGAGRSAVSNFAASRPAVSERVAVARAVAYAEAVGAPIYLVHVSTADGLAEADRAQARGVQVYVETRPIYLYFTADAYELPDAAVFASYPPLRTHEDVESLWRGLAAGDVHTCCTDHSAVALEHKVDESPTIHNVRGGIAELETMMPMLFSEGVRKGRLTIERFVEVTSTNAAKIFGLFPRKGTIAVGSDADLVLWDPMRSRTLEPGDGQSRAGFSVYDGREIVGWPERTISRGETVYLEGEIVTSAARGKLIPRARTRPL